ncbi:TetR/AcrR family transcriptional regulator [Aeromicrobium sp. CF4.19]|uniref:TetR/AcrR family transcriptional regulator n=1 Tax=Aeromicrobium sp. CF4.19 TaxID=3373082 RepID=UPI003EE71D4F
MPKIIGGSLAEHREQTRAQVFEALTDYLEHESYGDLTMAELAMRSGVGRTALYNHFRDKDDVVVAYATSETQRYLDRLEAELAPVQGEPLKALGVYVRTHLALAGELHFGFGPELYAMLSRDSLVRIREHVQDVEAVLRAILEDGVAAGAVVTEDVTTTMSLVHACLQRRDVAPAAVEAFVVRAVVAR